LILVRDKEAWLGEFLNLPHGIPSHDIFAQVFQLLDPKQLQRCYRDWIDSIRPVLADRDIVSLDGKTLRGSQDRSSGKRALHLLHARSVEADLVFGHRGMDEK